MRRREQWGRLQWKDRDSHYCGKVSCDSSLLAALVKVGLLGTSGRGMKVLFKTKKKKKKMKVKVIDTTGTK